MDKKIKEIIDLLENDLKDIESAVSHIENAEVLATEVVESAKNLTKSFSSHLSNLTNKINGFVERQNLASHEIMNTWRELSANFEKMSERLEKMITYYESVNFPARLDKIEALIAGLNQDLKASQNSITDIHRKLDEYNLKLTERIDRNNSTINRLLIIVIVFGIVSVINLILTLLG